MSFLANDEVFGERPIGGRPFDEPDARNLGDLVYLLRWVNGGDLSDTWIDAGRCLGPARPERDRLERQHVDLRRRRDPQVAAAGERPGLAVRQDRGRADAARLPRGLVLRLHGGRGSLRRAGRPLEHDAARLGRLSAGAVGLPPALGGGPPLRVRQRKRRQRRALRRPQRRPLPRRPAADRSAAGVLPVRVLALPAPVQLRPRAVLERSGRTTRCGSASSSASGPTPPTPSRRTPC